MLTLVDSPLKRYFAFMSGYEWPWVDPATGQTKTLPTKARFDAMPHP